MSTSIVLIDSTVRLRWEMSKAELVSRAFGLSLVSPIFAVRTNNHDSKWVIRLYPKGKKEANRNQVTFVLQNRYPVTQTARYDIAVETEGGYWPNDTVKQIYALNDDAKVSVFDPPSQTSKSGECRVLCSTQEFCQRFQNDKIAVVTTLVIYGAGVDYLHHEEAAKDYVKNVRSIPDLDSLTNITIVCQGKRFNCHKTVLASMSTFFRAKFTQNFKDKNAKVIKITDWTAELVEQMINFISSGLIPDNINETAGELIKMSTFYGIEALTKVCETALVKNLSSENVISTFLSFDKFVPMSEQRNKIFEFIKTERKKVVKSKDWDMFCSNHPNLVGEILGSI